MSKYSNALKHQMELSRFHSEAIDLLQSRFRDLNSGPTEIPRTMDALAVCIKAAGMIELAETVTRIDKMYAPTLDAKRNLDSTLGSIDQMHSVQLKQMHFGLNWIKIDAYDLVEDFMKDLGLEPETSYFDGLMNEIVVDDSAGAANNKLDFGDYGSGADAESLKVLRQLEPVVKSKEPLSSFLTERELQQLLQRAADAEQRISTHMPQGDRMKRLILDQFKSRIGILKGEAERLAGDEIVLRSVKLSGLIAS